MNTRLLPFYATLLICALAYTACVMQFPAMLSTRVAGNLLTDNAFLGIAAVGMTFVILSGGIDLSVGSVIAFTGVLLAVLITKYGVHPLAAFAMALVITTTFGAIMGFIIYYLDVPAFIVTLAGMFLMRGMCFVMTTDSIPINHDFYSMLQGMYYRLPGGGRLTFIGCLMVLVFLVGIMMAHFSKFGSYIYAIGGNCTSAELMGIPVARTTITIYALSGFLSGLCGYRLLTLYIRRLLAGRGRG